MLLARKWERCRESVSRFKGWASQIKANQNYGRVKRWLGDLSVAVLSDSIAALILCLCLCFRGR